MSVHKSSVSFDPQNWKLLKRASNKSRVVNDALHLYFLMEATTAEEEVSWSEKEMAVLCKEWDHYKKSKEAYSYDQTFDRPM